MLLTKASLTWDKELVDKNTAKPVINPPSAPTSADPLAPDIQAVIEEAVRSTTSKRYPAPAIFKPYLKGLAQLLRIELPTPETRAGVVRLLADRIDALTTWLPSYLCAAVSSPVSVPLGHLVYPTDLVEIPENLPTLLYGALRPMILTAPSKEIDPSFHLRSLIERRAMEHNKKPLHTDSLLTSLISATPFKGFFATPVPVPLPYEQRFQHTQIIGGSGAGKTQLLQHLILHDLKTEPRPSIVVIDSQGALIKNISRLALFDYKPPIIISPKSPSAINIFDVKRLGTYDETEKEQVIAAAIETLDYLFSGFGIELTGKQGILFRYSVRLMLALKTAGHTPTILDMVALLADKPPPEFQQALKYLSDTHRHFFETDFLGKTFKETKEQVRYRLQAILENPTISRLFTAKETELDLFTALNNGAVVLIDTDADYLQSSSPMFGRIFISLVLRAIFERVVILPEDKRQPTFLYIDEAQEYFDKKIDNLLTQARKFRLGCVFAHHHLNQCTAELRASFDASTAIKFASKVAVADAHALAPQMRTTPEFLLNRKELDFAAYLPVVSRAVSFKVPYGEMENEPRSMSDRPKSPRQEPPRQEPRREPPRKPTLSLPSPPDEVRPSKEW